MSNRTALAQLVTCLRGELPVAPNWVAILSLANRALVTPQIYIAMTRSDMIGQLPEEVREFLLTIWMRNRERNRRLSVQLGEALRALNSVGIEPVLLKGVGVWGSFGFEAPFDRILSDIDLLVKPAEAEIAVDALEKAGSQCLARYPKEMHVVAEFGRSTDVGSIDLHWRPSGPLGVAEVPDLSLQCAPVSWQGGNAQLPAPALQIFFLVLHDQFHDGGYWRGGIDLRHLLDIRDLSKDHSIDWSQLMALCQTRLVCNAVESQLIAAKRLVQACVPQHLTQRLWTRAQFRRHLWQFAHPRFCMPLALVAIVAECPNLIAYLSLNERRRQKLFRTFGTGDTLLGRLSRHGKRLKEILLPRVGKL